MDVFVDFQPNLAKTDEFREVVRQQLRNQSEQGLEDAIKRIGTLSPMIVVEGEYRELLQEARKLYVHGYFYSCVAMCGIVGERLVKDVLRVSILVQKRDSPHRPSDDAFDQLERIDVKSIVLFLKKAELLGPEAAKAVEDLGQLRNAYAHARGKKPQSDAVKAIKLLDTLVDGTVSVFKDYELRNGTLVQRTSP